jgi:hypothetical protein
MIAVKEDQSNIKMVKAKDIIQGKIPLANLPQPYVFIYESAGNAENLEKAVNIIATKMGYRVVAHTVNSISHIDNHHVCMLKE